MGFGCLSLTAWWQQAGDGCLILYFQADIAVKTVSIFINLIFWLVAFSYILCIESKICQHKDHLTWQWRIDYSVVAKNCRNSVGENCACDSEVAN